MHPASSRFARATRFGPIATSARRQAQKRAGAIAVAVASAVALASAPHSLWAAPPAPFQVPSSAGRKVESAPFDLPAEGVSESIDPSSDGVREWFRAMPPVEATDPFGSLIVRAARVVLGRPYANTVEVAGQEIVDYNVGVFQCVSFVESTLAVARCAWDRERTPQCFRREVSRLRYRHGTIDGYGSRLHYFEDWLADNAARGTLIDLTEGLSRRTLTRRTAYMSDHPGSFPGLQDPTERRLIEATERRLSRRPTPIVRREDFARIAPQLEDGDIVAIVTKRPDILIRHAGLVDRDSHGVVRLLHASSLRGRVVRTQETLNAYLLARPGREGVLIARPTPPRHRPAP